MTSLELFKSEEIELNLVMCPLPQTLNVFEKEYKGFLEEISIRFPNVSVFLSADLREGRKIKRPSYQEREKWRKKIGNLESNSHSRSYFNRRVHQNFKPNVRYKNCGYGETICISSTGEVFPCNVLDISVGHILRDKPKILLEKLYGCYKRTQVDYLIPCRNCDLRNICGGNCRIDNLRENNDASIALCSKEYKSDYYKTLVSINKFIYNPLHEIDTKMVVMNEITIHWSTHSDVDEVNNDRELKYNEKLSQENTLKVFQTM